MPLAIFGIDNTALNLAVTLVILMLFAIWIALIVFTFTDARRRIADPFLVGCATAASFFPFVGTLVYTILRPPEFLEDIREREIEVNESEVRLRHLKHSSCHKCGSPVESDFIRCPACRTRLKEPCPTCSKPVGLNWKVCPYCETTLIAPKRTSRSGSKRSKSDSSRSSSRSSRSEGGDEKRRRSSKTSAESAGSESRSPESRSSESRSSRRSSSRSQRSEEPTRQVDSSSAGNSDSSSRTPRSARRKAEVSDDEQSEPINRGDN